jgi:glutamate-1-semialdehyde 2,1-aminomutase
MTIAYDHAALYAALAAEYERRAPVSAALHRRAQAVMVDGGSHALRLIRPFPPRIAAAQGAWITDEDGHRLLDFWQGHGANLLGHNPPVITQALAQSFAAGQGLQTGFTDRLQIETAELLCRLVGAERVRFTTSGALATMYAVMLARAFTGRQGVLKVGGGWHGGQPWGLVGVSYAAAGAPWRVEGEGLPAGIDGEVLVARYNDPQALTDAFRAHGDRIACFIVEPFIGAGGYLFATAEYLRTARALCDRHGALLIADEVISGFRFRAGDLMRLYGVQPDLAAFAKIIGGGMPVAAVAGRAAVLGLAGRAGGGRVRFSGGTYSAHPASLLAGRTMLAYLAAHEAEIYPRLARLGRQARQVVETAFRAAGVPVCCTGAGVDGLPDGSLFMPHFPLRDDRPPASPDEAHDPDRYDVELRDHLLQLALLLEDVHVVHGGSVTAAHTEADLDFLAAACARAAAQLSCGQ